MTTFSRTWNGAYEAQPADVEAISIGASRIRNFKEDVHERMEVDHSWDGDAEDGAHIQVTFAAPLAGDPANAADKGFLYTKDVSSKVELFWEDEDGNVVQLTEAGGVTTFPAGTRMLFQQTAAPTGWTKDTTANLNDTALRIVTGSVGSEVAQSDFSTVFGITATDGHALTIAELAAHNHLAGGAEMGPAAGTNRYTVTNHPGDVNRSTSSTGSGDTHAHDIDLRVNYHDVIIATKD